MLIWKFLTALLILGDACVQVRPQNRHPFHLSDQDLFAKQRMQEAYGKSLYKNALFIFVTTLVTKRTNSFLD